MIYAGFKNDRFFFRERAISPPRQGYMVSPVIPTSGRFNSSLGDNAPYHAKSDAFESKFSVLRLPCFLLSSDDFYKNLPRERCITPRPSPSVFRGEIFFYGSVSFCSVFLLHLGSMPLIASCCYCIMCWTG